MVYFPENRNDWKKIASVIKSAPRVFLTTHINPDGDAIGSEMAFAGFLHAMNKSCRIINHSSTPELYAFLDPENSIEFYSDNRHFQDDPQQADVVIFLDLGNYSRAGNAADFLVNCEAIKIVIDHHPPESVDADFVVVNTKAASTGSLVFDLFCHMDASLMNEKIATALLTAIVTDTGYFTYSNTTSVTHRIAAALYEYGVTASDIRKILETRQPFCRQKLLGLTMAHVQISTCGRIGYSYITSAMFQKSGAKREHTDGIINQIRIIENIKVAILFVQEGENHFRASFRSMSSIPVNDIASLLGGGGHEKAAGADVYGSLEDVISNVLDTVTKTLDNEE